jgi:uncharacterized protein
MNIHKSDYINFRIKRAEESYHDAKYLIEKGSWNAAINRLYYSCFYAVLALLIKHDSESKSHKGVRVLLGQKYIKTGIIPKEFGQIYSDLFDFRLKGDYGDLFNFDAERVVPFVPKVEKFLEIVKTLINKN